MKVKELIERLQKLDSEATIGTLYDDLEYFDYSILDKFQVLSKDDLKSKMKQLGFEEDEDSKQVDYVIW